MKGHLDEFREQMPDFQERYAGHETIVDNNTVTFFGDWEAAHEAWLFRQWLEEQGHQTTWGRNRHGNKDVKTVIVATGVDVPSWARVMLRGKSHVILASMGERVEVHRDDVEEGVDELRQELWRSLQSVSGVGKSTMEKIADEFETPMDGVGSFDEVDGVGSATAESLDSFVLRNTHEESN